LSGSRPSLEEFLCLHSMTTVTLMDNRYKPDNIKIIGRRRGGGAECTSVRRREVEPAERDERDERDE